LLGGGKTLQSSPLSSDHYATRISGPGSTNFFHRKGLQMLSVATQVGGKITLHDLHSFEIAGGQLAHQLDGGKLFRRLVPLGVEGIGVNMGLQVQPCPQCPVSDGRPEKGGLS
jgi:hypothetical protein